MQPAVDFLLVRPSHPSNVGAAARAIKTMGFEGLGIVAPRRPAKSERAYALATHAADVVEEAWEAPDLAGALKPYDLVVGTTMRRRDVDKAVLESRRLRSYLNDRLPEKARVALVFGPESTGLSNEEIEACDVLATIPTAHEHPSLNLAQSVMVFAYELTQVRRRTPRRKTPGDRVPDDPGQFRLLRERFAGVLETLGLPADSPPARHLLSRVDGLPRRDVALLHDLAKRLTSALENRRFSP